ncbi:Cadherin-like beta sandwich domain protein [Eubacteriaceae bacterium CHKCI005]|nr:Cadherin-like beta sandwich domain protein [Eubacteriaceae bacterium CHKCI005]
MKKFIRAMSLSIALCLLFALLPVLPVSAASSATLTVSSTQLSPGDTVTVTVGYSSSEPLRGADITVKYPSDIFDYVGHSFADRNNMSGSSAPTSDCLQFLSWYDTPGSSGQTSLTLGTITLEVKDSPAASGEIVVTRAEGSSGTTGKLVFLGTTSVTVSTQSPQEEDPPEEQPTPSEQPSEPEKESSNLLKSLTVSNATLSPAFNPDQPADSYSCSVPYEVESLDIKAVPVDSDASISIQNNKLKASGVTNVTVTVTPAAGSGLEKRHYTIAATRAAPPDAPALDSLEIPDVQLSPDFSPDVMDYHCQVPYETTALDINAICSDPDAVVELSDLSLASEGVTDITVTVSKDGYNPRVYTISVTRKDPHSSRLKSLSIVEAQLFPSFEEQSEPGAIFTCTVPYETESLHITAVPEDSAATIQIENNILIPGSTSRITITVSCEDQEDSLYYIDATRLAQSAEEEQEEDSNSSPAGTTQLIVAIAVVVIGAGIGIAVFVLYLKRNNRKS